MTFTTRRSWDGGFAIATDSAVNSEPAVVVAPSTTAPHGRVIRARVIDDVTMDRAQATLDARMVEDYYARHRIIVGGKDVTWFRGVQTPLPTYALVSPLLYGSGQLVLPQVNAAFEEAGAGSLSWLKKYATVVVQRVGREGTVLATDYRGFISDDPHEGGAYSVTLGGEATGRAAMQDRPSPIFPQVNDIGSQVIGCIRHNLRLPTKNAPTTGIQVAETGGAAELDFLTEILAKSVLRNGTQWTVMPTLNGVYRMFEKDLETIDATIYVDGYQVAESLKRDFTEETDRVWASGVAPDGRLVDFAIYPGLMNGSRPGFPGSMSAGDTDADTTTGGGITALTWRLWTMNLLDGDNPPSEWTTAGDDPVTAAVEDLQADAGLTVTGTVNSATWDALFDADDVGWSLRLSQKKPAAQKPFTFANFRNASGQVIGPNPSYKRSRPFADASVEMGPGFTQRQIQKWAKRRLSDDNTPNWVGTITLNMGAVIAGEHNRGDALPEDLMDARALRPGMNVWLPGWYGGTLVHVSGVNVSATAVELTVDTRARDTMAVWEVIRRNRESRKHADRQWIAQNRSSGMSRDSLSGGWNVASGKVDDRVFCPSHQWTLFPTVGGREGQARWLHITTDDAPALFAVSLFGRKIAASRLNRLIGNPLTKDGTKAWNHNNKALTDDRFLMYAAGSYDQPGGYWPEVLDRSDTTTTVQTGTAQAAGDMITITSHGLPNGRQVTLGGTIPGGLSATTYYVVGAASSTFQLAATAGGSAIGITADATNVSVTSTVSAAPPAVTGIFRDSGGFAYFCKGPPVLWVAVYADRNTWVQPGYIMHAQLNDQS